MKNSANMPRMRLGFAIWLLGMIGVVSLLFILPGIISHRPISIPVWAVCLIQMVQSSIMLALAVWIGVSFAHKVNLYSPAIEALVLKKPFFEKLRPQLKPACFAGLLVGVFLIGMGYLTPNELSVVTKESNFVLKIFTEVLYGGVTEEILLRWGIMTLMLWLLWRFIQRDENHPSARLVWIAIIASSILFALGHLPAAHVLAGYLTLHIVTYVMAGNVIAGIIFGYLYKQFGLESAMIAHALAHLVKDVAIIMMQ